MSGSQKLVAEFRVRRIFIGFEFLSRTETRQSAREKLLAFDRKQRR